jgi:diguanylate cyclase (GGDEF)-like protein
MYFFNQAGRLGLVILCFLLCISPLSAEGARKKKILVLHSYHQGLEWTDNITAGIQSVFKPRDKNYEIYYEYLDTKRNTGRDYDDRLKELFTAKMKTIRFEVVIVADNNALNFINKHYETLVGHPPVVFCGINNFHPDLTDKLPFVTGVTEETDLAGNFELMMRLHPERKRIVVLLDRTATGQALEKPLQQTIAAFRGRIEIDVLRDFTLDEAITFVSRLGAEDMIFLLTFNRDRNNNFVSYSEAAGLLSEATPVPVYGPWDFYLGKGIVGGIITSGFQQGAIAARLALRITLGENPRDIPVVTGPSRQVMIDYRQAQAFHIDFRRLPDDTIIVNKPPGFYEKYHRIVLGGCLVVILVLAFCLLRLLMQKCERDRLVEMNNALDKLVEQKTARLQANNRALQKIAMTDDLTGLFNRGYLLKQLAAGIEAVDRQGGDLSIILVDVDSFKWINDTFGHDYGDEVLKQISAKLRASLREKDLVGRYGGEEFLMILPETDLDHARIIAQRIREGVQACQWERKDCRTTLSGGVVQYRGESIESLLKRADNLLYQAKDLGRNRMEDHLLSDGVPVPCN